MSSEIIVKVSASDLPPPFVDERGGLLELGDGHGQVLVGHLLVLRVPGEAQRTRDLGGHAGPGLTHFESVLKISSHKERLEKLRLQTAKTSVHADFGRFCVYPEASTR